MREISDIISAYHAAIAENKKTALATVVSVEGSSYRRPGARMLITEDGMLTGAISGGCLEGDALRKALLAIRENKNKLVTYDTTDEDDARFGVQLGCNGIVHILFEPLDQHNPTNPVELLKRLNFQRRPGLVTTFFSLSNKDWQPGTAFTVVGAEVINNTNVLVPQDLYQLFQTQSGGALQNQVTTISEAGDLQALMQVVQPAVSLVIVGAGNDAIPLASLSRLIGWETTIVDGRPTHTNSGRFPGADRIIVSKAGAVLDQLPFDDLTAFVLMTHNYNYDLEMLRQLITREITYIGLLGPVSKLRRMMQELGSDDSALAKFSNIFSPVGLDIGAETADEIALSVTAEIMSVMRKTGAGSLRNKKEPIHVRNRDSIMNA